MQHPMTERVLAELAEGHAPDAIAEGLVDEECSRGDYAGCSSELEMAYTEYENLAERLLVEAGGR